MTLGECIKDYREKHSISQREFARRCGISNTAIQSIENGFRSDGRNVAPKFDTIRKIARAMGTTAEVLISKCEDFDLDLSDTIEDTPFVREFVKNVSNTTPDEGMLLQAYRLIPVEHRLEALEAILRIKGKYEK